MVQQISYAQEIKDLMEQQEVAATCSLKTLHPFIDQEGLLRVGGRLQQSTLSYQTIHQIILPASQHFTKLITSAEHIRLHDAGPQLLTASLREKYWIPRIRNLVKTGNTSLPNLLQIQGTSYTTAHGRATITSSSTFEAIPYNWHRLCWTHLTETGNHTQQDNNKRLQCYFCLLCYKGCPY